MYNEVADQILMLVEVMHGWKGRNEQIAELKCHENYSSKYNWWKGVQVADDYLPNEQDPSWINSTNITGECIYRWTSALWNQTTSEEIKFPIILIWNFSAGSCRCSYFFVFIVQAKTEHTPQQINEIHTRHRHIFQIHNGVFVMFLKTISRRIIPASSHYTSFRYHHCVVGPYSSYGAVVVV